MDVRNVLNNRLISQGDHWLREGVRLAVFNLVYILVSITVVACTSFLMIGAGFLMNKWSLHVEWTLSLIFLLIIFEMIFAGAAYFGLWIRFIQSDCRLSASSRKGIRSLGISCLGAVPNLACWSLLPLLPLGDSDSCGGFAVAIIAYLIFSMSTIIMPLVGMVTGMQWKAPKSA